MDRWEYANVVLGCFCIVVSLLPTGYLISNNRYKRRLYLFFLLICVANILMAVGSLPEYLLDAGAGGGERILLLLGRTLYYGAFTLLLFFFLQYIFEYLRVAGEERRVCSACAVCMTGALMLLTVVSPFTGAAFYVTESGLQNGPLFFLFQGIVLLLSLIHI